MLIKFKEKWIIVLITHFSLVYLIIYKDINVNSLVILCNLIKCKKINDLIVLKCYNH